MAKTIVKFLLIGCIFTLFLGAATVTLGSWRLFLLLAVILGVAAFIPLIILSFTSDKVPRPTVYGTSAPGKFTTINANEGEGKKENKKFTKWAILSACTGISLLAAFFIFSILTLS